MQDITAELLQIVYDGPAIVNGRMPMESLATGLRGQALLIHRVKDIIYEDSVSIRVEVDPDFRAGSFVIPVHVLSDGLYAARHFLAGEGATALANLMQFLGFSGISGVTIYKLFKRLRGRRIEKPEDIPKELNINLTVEMIIRVYNDAEVQKQLRRVLEPLHEEGIEEFQTRRQGVVVESVLKRDLFSADEAELEDIVKDEEIDLGIEKAAWRKNLAWHFNDGEKSFDAKIEDKAFWKRIQQGESFSDGDRLRAHLKTTARRTRKGTLKIERTIPEVLGVDHVRRKQPGLFEDERTEDEST